LKKGTKEETERKRDTERDAEMLMIEKERCRERKKE